MSDANLRNARNGYISALRNIVAEKKAAFDEATAQLNAVLNGTEVKSTKAAKKAPNRVSATPKKGPGRKPKAKIDDAVSTKTRNTTKSRPSLKEAVATVLGTRTMGIQEVVEALRAKSWLPESANERGYVSTTLSSNKDLFEAVSRGQYRLIANVTSKPSKKVVEVEDEDTDEENDDVGAEANPFS